MPFIPHTPDDIAHMLAVIGAPSIDALFDEIPAALKAKPLDGVPPALCEMDVGRLVTERADRRRPPAQLHRRRRLRAPHPGARLGHRHARRVLFGVHALSGGGEPGHAAADLRISVDDLRPHRHGGRERLAVRWRLRARGGLSHGGALEPRLDVAPHPHAAHRQSDIPQGGASRSPASRTWSSKP